MPDATGGQCHSHIATTGDPPRCRQRRVRVRARCAARRCRRVVGRRAAIGPQLRRAAPLRHLGRPSPPSDPGARVCRTVRQLGAAARRAPRAGEQHRRRHRLAGEPRRGGGGGGGGAARAWQGEAFRRGERRSVLRISRVPAGPGTALVLPEACRVGVCTPGALPRGTEVLWRAGLGARSATPLERCIAPRPFWVTVGRAADACLVARSLPRGAAWAAHLRASPLPTPSELESLLEAGCGGVAVRWEHGGRRLSFLLSRNVS
mmetsp:Transcript_34557/g.112806  ORF Transcript_34557/g.112806 Transcript_34557/m.112806 type:complete len:262 (+) Transcript_34557:208-993(+)